MPRVIVACSVGMEIEPHETGAHLRRPNPLDTARNRRNTCLMPDCDLPTWIAGPFCMEHLVEAVNRALPDQDRAAFRDGWNTVLKTLTYRERNLINLRYGFADGCSYPLEEIARIFEITRERVRQIEFKAVRKLMHPVRSRAIEELCKKFFESYDFGKLASKTAGVLVQSVVVPGDKTEEGHLIEAVTIPWFMIMKLIEKDPSIVHQIGPRKWEELIAGWYSAAGFDEVTLTPRSRDLGRDVIAVKRDIVTVRVIDQVKAYGPEQLVPADDVRALLGVLQADPGATKGYVTTTSDFAPMIKKDKFIAPFIPFRLELVNRTSLLDRLKEVTDKKRELG